MTDEARERRRNLLWGVPASLIVHALMLTLLVYGLSRPPQQVREEEPVNVSLVPPSEQPKPKPVPPPPVAKAEKPPEPKPPEQPRKPVDVPVLKRVFQYGAKDSGPEKSLDGSSAQGNAQSPAKDATVKPPVEPKPALTDAPRQADAGKTEEKPVSPTPKTEPAQSEKKQTTEETDKQQLDKPEAAPQPVEKQAAAAPKLPDIAGSKPAPRSSAGKAKPKPAKAMSFKPAQAFNAPGRNPGKPNNAIADAPGSPIYSGLPGVRKLYSQGATGDALATSSMDNVPRGQRVANLCGNVLTRKLQMADYTTKWIPTIILNKGNVLDPPDAAFSTTNAWYGVKFRCEVDADATMVRSFTFQVGASIPRSEWVSRGFMPKYPLN